MNLFVACKDTLFFNYSQVFFKENANETITLQNTPDITAMITLQSLSFCKSISRFNLTLTVNSLKCRKQKKAESRINSGLRDTAVLYMTSIFTKKGHDAMLTMVSEHYLPDFRATTPQQDVAFLRMKHLQSLQVEIFHLRII